MKLSPFTFGYFTLALSTVITWILARLRPDFVAPFGLLMRRMAERKTHRIAVLAIWWWIGWHFFGQPFPN